MVENQSTLPIPVYSVSDLNAYIRALLESNENLIDIWVAGEISNISQPRSGHLYFTLKDENAQVRCVVWRNHAMRMADRLRDGMQVEAHGAIGVYEGGGQYQLYIDGIRAAGEGRLYQEFLRLKDTLETEGLFDEAKKRPIPKFPMTIGIVTSPTAAALQDMLNTLRGRYPLASVILSPTSVQGDAAPAEIVSALELLHRHVKPDVILIGRGGGSLEDLWAFNDERVARAVANSPTPIISGVGHETDFTLTDFAADLRAPTPTGAAVSAVPDIAELSEVVQGMRSVLVSRILDNLVALQAALQSDRMRLSLVSPRGLIRQRMQDLDQMAFVLNHRRENFFQERKRFVDLAAEKIAMINPLSVLKRGYTIITNHDGEIISSVKQVQLGEEIHARILDGVIESKVTGKKLLKEKNYGK